MSDPWPKVLADFVAAFVHRIALGHSERSQASVRDCIGARLPARQRGCYEQVRLVIEIVNAHRRAREHPFDLQTRGRNVAVEVEHRI